MTYQPKNPNGQATMANSEPVVIASDQSAIAVDLGANNDVTVTSGSITETNSAAIKTSVELIDDAVYTDGTGTASKGIAVMGTDGTNPQIISTNASGHVNIADGGNTITVDGTVGVSGSVTVQDGGGSVTVDNNGTFATQAAQSGTWNITNVSGTVSLPTGASTSANQSTIITGIQLLDDAIVADDAAFTPATTKVNMAGFEVDETTTDTLDEGDAGAARIDTSRRQLIRIVGATDANRADVDASGHLQVDLAASSTNVTVADGGGSLTVDNNGTFAVQAAQSGTWNVTNVSGTVSLPTGASTLAEQQTQTTALQLVDDIVYTDDTSTHSTGSSKGALIMAAATPTDTAVNANDIGAVGMTNNREMYVSLRDISGTAAVSGSGTATGALRVEIANNGTGQISTISTVTAMGSGTSGPMKAEDAAHNTGDQGFAVWAVGNEAQTSRAADGDYLPMAADVKGNLMLVGNIAHDTADAGNPIKIGGKARQTNPTAVADLDRVEAMYDDVGKQVTILNGVRDLVVDGSVTLSATTSESTILSAGAAGVFHDITALMIANTSASTASRVDIRDATGGSVRFSMQVPGNTTMGICPPTPIKQTTAANNWTAQCASSVTDIRVFIQAVKNV